MSNHIASMNKMMNPLDPVAINAEIEADAYFEGKITLLPN